jgi:hypothetical protein
MEKSIENIWKEGFLKNDVLVAPTLNNLYNQKSIHIIDKFKRMFKINLIAIVGFSSLFLVVSFFIGIPLMGIIFFVTLSVLVVINKNLLNGIEKIDTGASCYDYLKSFNLWINKQVNINQRLSSILYPIFFLAFILGFWFKEVEGIYLGERLVTKLLQLFPNMDLLFGLPLIGIGLVVFTMGLLAFFGGKIYQWDLNIVYGRIFKKLKELMTDLEKLNTLNN